MNSIRNQVQLIGRLGQDAELKKFESGKVTVNARIATNEFYKNKDGEKVEETQWHTLIAWGKTAEIIGKYAGKGKEIAVEGKLISRSYENKEGEKRYVTEVVANEVLLLGAKTGSPVSA